MLPLFIHKSRQGVPIQGMDRARIQWANREWCDYFDKNIKGEKNITLNCYKFLLGIHHSYLPLWSQTFSPNFPFPTHVKIGEKSMQLGLYWESSALVMLPFVNIRCES